jgi:hypothetical protein
MVMRRLALPFFFLFSLLSSCTTPIPPADYYVAPDGNDNAAGDEVHPFATLNKVWSVVAPGNLVYLRGGTYVASSQKQIWLSGKSGTEGNLIRIWAYPGETPVITKASDYLENSQKDGLPGNYGLRFDGDYVHWRGIEITGFAQLESQKNVSFGFHSEDSNHNIFELLNIHHNGHGMAITHDCTDNLILNSDFHHNQDPYTDSTSGRYGNADGFELAYIPEGNTNTIRGCRSWWNTDDGFDLWEGEGNVVIENSWAWYNGFVPDTFDEGGDGNGFKLGRTLVENSSAVLRSVRNSLAFKNAARGFDQNGALCGIEFFNNTAYQNGFYGFLINQGTFAHVLRNNIAIQNQTGDVTPVSAETVHDHNSWDSGVTASDDDFESVDWTGVDGPRQEDGSLPVLGFLHLKNGSDLIDAGVDAGLPFTGNAPDLGAFELP